MNISKETIPKMLEILELLDKNSDIDALIKELLNHEDYKVQFDFFQNHHANIRFTKEEYIYFLSNIRTINPEHIRSNALKHRVDDLISIIDNISFYREVYNKLEEINEVVFDELINRVNNVMPIKVNFEDVRIVFAIGLGVTGGFLYEDTIFLDFKKVISDKSFQGVLNTLCHELYHYGFYKTFSINTDNQIVHCRSSLLFYYLGQEGLAVKFGNNFEGKLTKKINEENESTVDEISCRYYHEHFNEIFETLKSDLHYLEEKLGLGVEDVENIFVEHYLNRNIMIDCVLHEFYLKNPITYYLGADIWGLIYDVFGRSVVNDIITSPNKFKHFFNEAVSIIGKNELKMSN